MPEAEIEDRLRRDVVDRRQVCLLGGKWPTQAAARGRVDTSNGKLGCCGAVDGVVRPAVHRKSRRLTVQRDPQL